MDVLSNGNNKIQIHLNDTYYFDEEQCFKNVLKHDFTLPQRVQFHAYLKFLIHHKRKISGIDQWMRVIHNLSENTVIDGADEVAKAIKSIEKLIPHSNNILEYLKDSNDQIDFFHSRQVQEERIKACLITNSQEWKDEISKIEKHPYFKGQVLFLFEFAGILEYFERHGNCDWSSADDTEYLNGFIKYSNGAGKVFQSILNSSSDIDFLWERAVLSKGNYLIPASAFRWNLLSTTIKMRDFSWKRLVRLPPVGTKEPESNEWKTRRFFIKAVFDDNLFDLSNLTQSLTTICKTLPDDWRQYFIANPEFYSYSEQGFIRYEDESKILLFKQSQQNHYHVEMYSYDLYLNMLSERQKFDPFTRKFYFEVKSGDEFPCIIISGWENDGANYAIEVFNDFNDVSNKSEPYKIRFCNRSNFKVDNYPNTIQSIMDSNGFQWIPHLSGFCKTVAVKDSAISVIENLSDQLKLLS